MATPLRKDEFGEPWRAALSVQRTFKYLPTETTEEERGRVVKDESSVNALMFASPGPGKSKIACGEIVAFTPPGTDKVSLDRAERICACVNSMAGIPDPELTVREMRDFLRLLSKGEIEESLMDSLNRKLGVR